ncbi:MAG: vitamin B12 dependent-methionine synthase activation domain-containing protein [Anaerolineae bacterium]
MIAVNVVSLNEILFKPELGSVLRKLRVKEGTGSAREVQQLLTEAQAVAKPKVLYRAVYVGQRGEDSVEVDGQTFKSRVLRVNLDPVHRVFPYVATCGTELDEWSSSIDDMLQSYWADAIKEMALRSAMRALSEHLQDRFRPGRMSRMSPGSLEDWPIYEQRKLFALLGDPEDAIGVRLTDSLIMVPLKSLSGIWFPTEVDFASCQLCSRESCVGRRAPYDENLYDEKYRAGAD